MRWFILVLIAGLGLAFLPASGLADAGKGSDALEALIVEMADTPAEHRALASHFRAKAEQSRELAEMHRQMGRRYGGKKITEANRQREHCDRLVKLSEEQAKEYEALAESHEKQAGK